MIEQATDDPMEVTVTTEESKTASEVLAQSAKVQALVIIASAKEEVLGKTAATLTWAEANREVETLRRMVRQALAEALK
jgi:hypothetical protein